jgi:GAF domain-containing protein
MGIGPAERRGRPSSKATSAVTVALSQRLADLARYMQHQAGPQAVLDIVVSAVVGTIPGAEEATITLVHARRQVVSAAATSDLARRFDDLQEETRQGPCLDAMFDRETMRVDDLATDPRWPDLARRAAEIGVCSVLCFQLFAAADDLGALNLLARRPGAFTDESERIGLLYASHIAVAVAGAQKSNHLITALGRRDAIGQAKGILMERYKITADQAFALLAQVSSEANLKLYEVAERLTHTGDLRRRTPDPPGAISRSPQEGR